MNNPETPDLAYRKVIALTGALFLSYLTVAISLSAVPVHVVQQLGLPNAAGGLAIGIAFLSTILTRGYAGGLSDRIGGKPCMQRGLVIYAVAGLICLLSSSAVLSPTTAYAVLLGGRLLLGLGESLAMVGMISWAIGLMRAPQTGRVMALVGAGMYGSFAAGGPLGLMLVERTGFAGAIGACTLLPLIGLAAIYAIPAVSPNPGRRESFWRIIEQIWQPGTVVGLQGVGFAVLGAFFSLYFLSRGWPYAGLGLTCFGVGFVVVRLLCGHLPDVIGGRPVALVSLGIEACGQFLLWLAPSPWLALVGSLLTGLGCSMVFPAMGADVVKRVQPHLRGSAIGGFVIFQDLAYSASGPLVGLLADRTGYATVFLVGGLAALLGMVLTIRLHQAARVATA